MRKKTVFLKDYAYITAGAFSVAFAVNYFLVPMKLSTGGVSGIGTVLYYIFSIPMSATTLIFNAVLFTLGAKLLGKSSVIKTVFGVIMLALFLEVVKIFGEYRDDIIIASVFGGIISGLGVGLTLRANASTGGSDFAAVMITSKLRHISVTTVLMLTDAVIILASGIVFRDFTIMLYSILSLYISSKCADAVIVQGDYAKSVLIVSGKTEEISKYILSELGRGVTGIYNRGIYSKSDGMMLMCIVRSKEIPKLTEAVQRIDSEAFTVVSDVRKVLGKGFERK